MKTEQEIKERISLISETIYSIEKRKGINASQDIEHVKLSSRKNILEWVLIPSVCSENINRLEIIDHCKNGDGRVYVKKGVFNLETQKQDNNMTLKLFLTDKD